MSILTSFIGIDKYQDQQVRDLTGARRDATALWALFSDTDPALKSQLIIDNNATVDQIRQAFEATLGAAGEDDIVILSFAGHGTHDHRLAAHDTDLNRLEETTIPMSELADRFKNSKAKAVLCILDCCFSGGAPARVLEDSPTPRDIINPFTLLAGRGRVLIAASDIHEVSYETPGTGHGLLTKALIDVLQEGNGMLDIQSSLGSVMDRVRAEAARIGVTQTPIMVGHVEGGFKLPVLKAGKNFFAAFPETKGTYISNVISDLHIFGLPSELLSAWSALFSSGLNNLQIKAVNEHRVLDGESLLVIAPTSSGKTFIGELAAARAVIEGRKAVFLMPYRALVNEKYDQFAQLYGEQLGMRVVRCNGDYLDQTAAFVRGKYDLALLTYEMFLNITLSNPSILTQMGLVVIDEAQFITDPNRGINVELLLTFLIMMRERGVSPQIIALSAVIGGVNNFDDWLGCSKLVTTDRPVPLIEGVLDRRGVFQYLDSAGNVQLEQMLAPGQILQRGKAPSAQDVIVPLVQKLIQQNEKIIVFRNQKGKAQGCAAYLAKDLNLPPATDVIAQLPKTDLSSTSADLRRCLEGGTAFHNTNLTREEKALVEAAYRDTEGPVKVLGATTTVAAGINTPASTVILAEQEFVGDAGRVFTVAEYKNMAGRAGRLGFNEEGKSIIYADTEYQRQLLFQRYVQGKAEPLNSSFDPQHLETWIVRLLAQIEQIPRNEVSRLLSNTFGGYLLTRNNPTWRNEIELKLEKLLAKMISLDLVEQEGDRIQLTLLGRACGRSSLSFDSAMRLVELLRQLPPHQLSAVSLMALVQVLPESDGGYTPMMKRGQSESVRSRQAAAYYGNDIARLLQRFAKDDLDWYARCKRAAILWDWIEGTPIDVIEQRYTANPFQGRIGHGEIRKFADNTRFNLRSAHQIANVMFVDGAPNETAIEALLKQLEVGIPERALKLLELPVSLTRGEYLALYHNDFTTAEDIMKIPVKKLEQLIGIDNSAKILRATN